METVEDDDGRRYVRLTRSATSSLVHDPVQGETKHVPNETVTRVEGTAALETAATAVPEPVRALITAVASERVLGLLLVLADGDDLDARALLDRTTFCEGDLFAVLRELSAAGLIERTPAEAWTLTARGEAAVAAVRQS